MGISVSDCFYYQSWTYTRVNGRAIGHSNELPPIIAELKPGRAAQLGVWRKGATRDVILALNGKRVTSVDQLRAILDKAGKHVALLVQREYAKIFVSVPLG